MKAILERQKLYQIGRFIHSADVDFLMSEIKKLDFKSTGTIIDKYGNATVDKEIRSSANYILDKDAVCSKLIFEKLKLVSRLLYADETKLEKLSSNIDIIKYTKGQKLTAHMDAYLDKKYKGINREYTVMIGLQAPTAGGETVFRKLGRRFTAVAGDAYVWKNLIDGNPDYDTVHEGEEVLSGEKYVAVLFINQEK